MSNHLKQQSSPYLLQHAGNPVDWYPWCEEAFEKAKKEDKPVFLSIGYSTCHWCHVMAHESFENSRIAEILNRFFISIKVDREERPDIDSVYMTFCQAFTGNGGWPMSIFMTAEQKPFFAGTYFPPESHFGMMGFRELLLKITGVWQNDRENLLQTAETLVANINRNNSTVYHYTGENLLEHAAEIFARTFDKINGGFGTAPKFPTPHNLIFLMLYSRLRQDENAMEQACVTLEKMRRGGIFDHIGYGFSRYSTDDKFLVPHFEKMLYDNALLVIAYAAAYKASGNHLFLDTAEKTAAYIFREMTGAEGEFYSAQDADSEGEEGGFYVWDYDEICNVLGKKKGKDFCDYVGVSREGNFEGKNIPNLLAQNVVSDRFIEETETLYHYRNSRARLHLDDKILTSWNSLMICALSILYRVTGKGQYLDAAKKTGIYIERNLVRDGIIYVSRRNGKLSVKGFLEDYAYYALAQLFLYDVTAEEGFLKRAEKICGEMETQFADEKNGGYFLYGNLNDSLVSRPKETYDGALPSGNSILAYCLVRLSQITGKEIYKERAKKQLAFLSAEASRNPAGYCMFLIALMVHEEPPEHITVVHSGAEGRGEIWRSLPLYSDIKIYDGETEEYRLLNGKTTYYVCRNFVCLPPSGSYCPDLK